MGRPAEAIIGWPNFNPDHYGIASEYAPVFFQAAGDVADYMTGFTYDGDWNGANNWNNLYYYPLVGAVYWAIEETIKHYFIFYLTFHPRDWCGVPGPFPFPFSILVPGDCWPIETYHENDLEGVVLVVDKFDTSPSFPNGRVVLAETRFHTRLRSYPNVEGLCQNNTYSQLATEPLSSGRRNLEPACLGWTNQFGGIRPTFFIEPQGHGVLSTTDGDVPPYNFSSAASFSGVVYVPGWMGGGEVPNLGVTTQYALNWIDWDELTPHDERGLWQKRLCSASVFQDIGQTPAAPYWLNWGGAFSSEDEPGGATAPWRWNDQHCLVGNKVCNTSIDTTAWFTQYAWWVSQSFNALGFDLIYGPNIMDHSYYTSNIFLDETPACGNPQFSLAAATERLVAPEARLGAGRSVWSWAPGTGGGAQPDGIDVVRTVTDQRWGRANFLAVASTNQPSPTIRLRSVHLPSARRVEVVVRYRATPQGLPVRMTLLAADLELTTVPSTTRVVEPDGWVVASAFLDPAHTTSVDLSLAFPGHSGGTLDVAFIRILQ